MRLKISAGNAAGAVILSLMVASCATDARDVQVRDSESSPPAKVSPEQQLEQQRQLEERQRDQRQQDRRQQDLERAQTDPAMLSARASSITRVPITVNDTPTRHDASPSQPEARRSIQGELLRIEGEYFVVRDLNGQEVRLQVTNDTKMEDAVQVGDKIQAQVSEQNHAKTVRRVETQK